MKALLYFLMLSFVLTAGCDLFKNESTIDAEGWKRTSLPSTLKADWKLNNVHYLNISSKDLMIDNREWGIITVDKKDDEYRLNLRSSNQYMSAYFRNITETTVEKAFGLSAYTSYDATNAIKENWILISKD
jgi:hypothetical protein